MAEHLITQTLPETAAALAAYYQQAIGSERPAAGDGPQASDAVQPGTRPEPRRDMDPALAALLGIDLTRPTTRDEIASLLARQRTTASRSRASSTRRPPCRWPTSSVSIHCGCRAVTSWSGSSTAGGRTARRSIPRRRPRRWCGCGNCSGPSTARR